MSGRYCANFNSALTLITLRNCQILGPGKNEWHFSVLLWHIVIFWQNSETLIVQYKQSLRLRLSWIEPLWKNRRYSREPSEARENALHRSVVYPKLRLGCPRDPNKIFRGILNDLVKRSWATHELLDSLMCFHWKWSITSNCSWEREKPPPMFLLT